MAKPKPNLKTKAKKKKPYRRKTAPVLTPEQREADTIAMFCARYGIAQSFYFKLQTMGRGPRVMKIGKRVLISREASEKWRREMESETSRQYADPAVAAIRASEAAANANT